MFRIASSRLSSRAASSSVSSTASFLASLTAKPSPVSLTPLGATAFRSYGNGLELDKSMANPDAINMINYALNQARTDKSIGSYGLGLLVLKHCLTIELTEGKDPKNENSKGIALLAMSTLEYERGEYDIALEKLQSIHELTNAYLGVRVAALEAEAGLYLELGQDDKASAIADKCVEVVEKQKTDDDDDDFKALILRAKALKGLIELVKGSIESAVPFFDKSLQLSNGTAALSYGEFLYLGQNYSMAKEVYTSVLKGASDIKKFGNPYLGACNMNLEGLMMGALCALGQLETYQGNYGNAEKALTQALTLAEETYGEKHPKVGVVLTSIALMYRRRAMEERTSSLMVQEGLYRKVIDILKVTETESEGSAPVVERSDIAAIARGGYAEILNVQENRKSEGEKLKKLAETIWKNRRLTLDEALLDLESTKISIIDPRISRIL